MKPLSAEVEKRPRPVILVFTAFYLPGCKGGGPIRSIANLVAALKDQFDFRIVTSDRDLGDRSAYPGIRVNVWQEVERARVLYLSPGPLRWWRVARLLRAGVFDLIYLNSFFSSAFSMLPVALMWFRVFRQTPVVLAPRGEFSPGALAIKASRKGCYLRLIKWVPWVYAGVFWHASSKYEELNILSTIPSTGRVAIANPLVGAKVLVAPDLVAASLPTSTAPVQQKIPGKLSVVFVSRISRMKNLNEALQILAGVRGEVDFNIYGPLEDTAYWAECQELISGLPANVKVAYQGELPHAQVAGVFKAHQLFLLPTCGENYGHVIVEALVAGCPVLISNQTPWRGLQAKGIGWDLPLGGREAFRQAIQECVGMDETTYREMAQRVHAFGLNVISDQTAVVQNRDMFCRLVSQDCPSLAAQGKIKAEHCAAVEVGECWKRQEPEG